MPSFLANESIHHRRVSIAMLTTLCALIGGAQALVPGSAEAVMAESNGTECIYIGMPGMTWNDPSCDGLAEPGGSGGVGEIIDVEGTFSPCKEDPSLCPVLVAEVDLPPGSDRDNVSDVSPTTGSRPPKSPPAPRRWTAQECKELRGAIGRIEKRIEDELTKPRVGAMENASSNKLHNDQKLLGDARRRKAEHCPATKNF